MGAKHRRQNAIRTILGTVTASPGRPCGRGRWCARATTEGDGRGGVRVVPATAPRAFCHSCTRIIDDRTGELPGFYRDLAADLAEPSSSGARAWSPFGPRLPFRAADEALMRLIAEITLSWELRVRADVYLPPLPAPDPGRPPWAAGPVATQADISRACRAIGSEEDGFLTTLIGLQEAPMTRTYSLRTVEDELAAEAAEQAAEAAARKKGHEWEPPEPGPLAWMRAATVVSRGVDDITLRGMLDGGHAGRELLAVHHRCLLVLGLTDPQPEDLPAVACYDCNLKTLRRADRPRTTREPVYWSQCKNCGHRMTIEQYDEHVKRLWGQHRRQARHQQ